MRKKDNPKVEVLSPFYQLTGKKNSNSTENIILICANWVTEQIDKSSII